jgi:hypothetical protein
MRIDKSEAPLFTEEPNEAYNGMNSKQRKESYKYLGLTQFAG